MLNGLGDKHASYSVDLIKDEFQSTNNEANGNKRNEVIWGFLNSRINIHF